MKKIMFLLLINHTVLYSQKLTAWGIKAGYIRSQIIGDAYKGFHKQGFNIGLFTQLQLSKKSALQLELFLINKGCSNRRDKNYHYRYYSYFDILYYVELPILFQFQYKKFLFEGGPGLGLLAWDHAAETSNSKSLERSPGLTEITANIGCGYQYSERLNIDIRYGNSIVPIRNKPTSQYNSVIALSLYYKLFVKET